MDIPIVKPKIGVIGLKGLPSFVGAGTVGENIIEQLKNDYDFYVYAVSSHTNLKSGYYKGIYQKVFKKLPFKKLNGFWYYLISALHARYVMKFDLVHVHNSFAAFTLLFLKGKYKVVLTTHGGFIVREKWKRYAWFFNYNTYKLVSKADYLCCVSKEEKRLFRNKLHLDAHYIPNGVNLVNDDDLPKINIVIPYIFFGAGRIIPSKGLHDLINALHKIKFTGKLLIAGDLDQMSSYKKQILKLAHGLDIDFLGLIKDKKMLLSYFKHAGFLVFPSHMEAMSIVLLEAVSMDCPVVCSDITENKDILNTGEVLYFKTKDPDDLAEKLNWAIENPEKMKGMAQMAKQRFLNEYSWGIIAGQYKEIFNKLLK